MAYFKKTNLFQKIVFSRSSALLILIAVVFVGYGLVSIVGKSIDASKARKIAEAQALSLKERQSDLASKIEILKTPEGQETSLREQLPVVKAGEHVVVITDDPSASLVQAPTQSTSSEKSGGFLNFLKNIFK